MYHDYVILFLLVGVGALNAQCAYEATKTSNKVGGFIHFILVILVVIVFIRHLRYMPWSV